MGKVKELKEFSLRKLWIAVKDFKLENAMLEYDGIVLTARLIETKANNRLDDAQTGELMKFREKRTNEIIFHSQLLVSYMNNVHNNYAHKEAKEEVQEYIKH